MKIIFLGGLFPNYLTKEIENNSKGAIQYAANLLQWNFIKGLDFFYKVDIVTLPYVGSFPFLYKKILLATSVFSHTTDSTDISLGFLNLPLIKHFYRYKNAKKELIKRIQNIDEPTTIIIYSIHSPFLLAAWRAKMKYPNTRLCLIVPDLPEYMSDNKNIFYLIFKKLDSYLIKYTLKKIDSFVVLTDQMANILDIQNKPYVRIEGIFEENNQLKTTNKENEKVIMYSGSLASRYGIMNLLKAFLQIDLPHYRLWICGEGDTRSEIEQLAKSNSRIKYFGQLTQSEVFLLQKRATVLVNPRTSAGDYTKYSFPSKTMEYLASGTPTILHRLPGIPSEYFQYVFIAEKETAEELKTKILEVCEKPQSELNEFGRKAQEFIYKQKNAISQVKLLSNMVNNLIA